MEIFFCMVYSQRKTSSILQLIKELNKIESKIHKEKLELASRVLDGTAPEARKKDILDYINEQTIHEDIASLRRELYRMLWSITIDSGLFFFWSLVGVKLNNLGYMKY